MQIVTVVVIPPDPHRRMEAIGSSSIAGRVISVIITERII
jgi:hypothetical protein